MAKTMEQSEIKNALNNLEGWQLEGDVIRRDYSFADFVQAMEFVNRVAGAAEEMGHHPDINIVYSKVTLKLSTHDAGGITINDIRMAETLNSLPTVSQNSPYRKAG